MRLALALLVAAFDPRVDFDFGPGVFAGADAHCVAGGVFDAGGGDGDGGDLVGEGVGPEGWFVLLLGLGLLFRGGGGGGFVLGGFVCCCWRSSSISGGGGGSGGCLLAEEV